MNATHETVVQQFRSGQAIADIAIAVGFTPRAIRRILQKKDVAVPRFRPYVRKAPKTEFQSRADGEYAKCQSCERLGYGIDAWHPATSEFWREEYGLLSFERCRACICDLHKAKRGRALLEIAA
ncbi:MAG: hypothetical protein AAGC76_09555 [Luteibacter sp.]|uniref:hypothetical protein n=1 Tax=Luteibacter sp. TaxID=1886636 RepID=UPI002807EA88|nr:hypothetical protein [Luteibacter sp.]MDQ7996086.1 hypothetical protein [Luteibacter sp.]